MPTLRIYISANTTLVLGISVVTYPFRKARILPQMGARNQPVFDRIAMNVINKIENNHYLI
jgi:hypothetical protein